METPSADLFNLNTESFVDTKPEKKTDPFKFNPDASSQTDKVYKAIIRFLPNWQDPNNKSKIKKHFLFLEDPISGDKFSVDCPSTVGKKSILKDTYWKLKGSDSAKDQELAKKFSRKTGYYSIIQIIDDKINPANNGKIMYWSYGVKVNEKIESELKPEVGVPHNPFDLFTGKLFLVDVCVKYDWNNYDSCKFIGDASPFVMDGTLKGTPIQKTKEDMEKVSEFLKANSPDLTKFEYQEWDEAVTQRVMTLIKNSVPDGRLVEQILGGGNDEPKSSKNGAAKKSEEYKKSPVASYEPESKESAKPAGGGNSSLDDLYKDL